MIDQLKALLLSFGTVCACVTIIVDKYMVGVGLGPAALRMMYVESPLLDNALVGYMATATSCPVS